jgi:hypothetical protein
MGRIGCVIGMVCLLAAPGCTAKKPLRWGPKDVRRVTYNPKDCRELPDGRVECKRVIFTLGTVSAK